MADPQAENPSAETNTQPPAPSSAERNMPIEAQKTLTEGREDLKNNKNKNPDAILKDMLKHGNTEEEIKSIEEAFLIALPQLAEIHFQTVIRESEQHDFEGKDSDKEELMKNPTFQFAQKEMRAKIFKIEPKILAKYQAEYMEAATKMMQDEIADYKLDLNLTNREKNDEMKTQNVIDTVIRIKNKDGGLGSMREWFAETHPNESKQMAAIEEKEAKDIATEKEAREKNGAEYESIRLLIDTIATPANDIELNTALHKALTKINPTDESANVKPLLAALNEKILNIKKMQENTIPPGREADRKKVILEYAQGADLQKTNTNIELIVKNEPLPTDGTAPEATTTATAENADDTENDGKKSIIADIEASIDKMGTGTLAGILRGLMESLGPLLISLHGLIGIGLTDEDIDKYGSASEKIDAGKRIYVKEVLKKEFNMGKKLSNVLMGEKIEAILEPKDKFKSDIIEKLSVNDKTSYDKLVANLKKDENINQKKDISLGVYVREKWPKLEEPPKVDTPVPGVRTTTSGDAAATSRGEVAAGAAAGTAGAVITTEQTSASTASAESTQKTPQ